MPAVPRLECTAGTANQHRLRPLNSALDAMAKTLATLALVVTLAVLSYATLYFLGAYYYPDQCMDLGHSFDYQSWECSDADSLPYAERPLHRIPGFWQWIGTVTPSESTRTTGYWVLGPDRTFSR